MSDSRFSGGTGEALEALHSSLPSSMPISPDTRQALASSLLTIYSPYMERMIQHGSDMVRSGNLDPTSTVNALGIAATLFSDAHRSYYDTRSVDNIPMYDTRDILAHQERVLNGDIKLLPKEQGTTVQQSIFQVMNANELLTGQPPRDQATLAALNYGAFFKPQTMAGGAKTLERHEIDDMLAAAENTQEAMPHLTVSNWAIGQAFAGLYRFVAHSPAFSGLRGLDMGSGHGATLAAITSSIRNLEDVDQRPELAITTFEATPEFYDELVDFSNRDHAIRDIGLNSESLRIIGKNPWVYPVISKLGTLMSVQGDAYEGVLGVLPEDDISDDQLTVVTANYSWHRLPKDKKAAIMEHLSELDNIVFLVGDLAQNSSAINRRYFNLAVNGPLNAGNRRLTELFNAWGYRVVDINAQRPDSVDPRLISRISAEDKKNDGHLWIAYKGQRAEDALGLVDVSSAA